MRGQLTALLLGVVEIIVFGLIAGFIGSLTGLGGGTVLTPLLTLFLRVPMAYAAGASLISTIATSSGAASAYIRDRITNVRIGMGLEITTTAGSIVGSLSAAYIYSHGLAWILYVTFGAVILFSIVPTAQRGAYELPRPIPPDATTRIFKLHGKYHDAVLGRDVEYHGVRWWLGEVVMFFAGMISGLLGIGSGALKVIGMDWAMNLPMKVTTTTSNFMIGVTAATGSSIYWYLGYIQPGLAALTAIGVLAGAMLGTRVLVRITNRQIRWIFLAILAFLGAEMLMRGLSIADYVQMAQSYEYSVAAAFAGVIISTLYVHSWRRRS